MTEVTRDIANPSNTIAILKRYNLQAKKSLGQNFLIDTNILEKIVAAGSVDKRTTVIEIGPGIGALTEQIARHAKQVYAFEIDQRLIPVLEETLADYTNIEVFNQDILDVNLSEFERDYLAEAERVVVMANLPYYITTPIIMGILESGLEADQLVFMVQKEVAARMSAEPGTKDYGSLSIALQYFGEPELAFTVPPTVFKPQPNVDSAIIQIKLRDKPAVAVQDEEFFFKLARAGFAQRRKTLWNNMKIAFGKDKDVQARMKEALAAVDIDASRRGETLSIAEYGALADALIARDIQFVN